MPSPRRRLIRWIAYLQRIATLYARGRLSVRPVQAEQMPPEIRELAETLEHMADAIVDTSACHLLEELATRVEHRAAALGRALFLIAESDLNDPRVVRSRDVGGYGIDAQ